MSNVLGDGKGLDRISDIIPDIQNSMRGLVADIEYTLEGFTEEQPDLGDGIEYLNAWVYLVKLITR